ncbi:MAG: DUF6161 domain-containing protein [Leptothrix sp. (in: b-proteobacteria)]
MSEVEIVPPAKPEPLFTLDLGDNGGLFAPTSWAELTKWIHAEQSTWVWLHQHSYGSHEQGAREGLDHLNQALGHAQQAQNASQSNPAHSIQELGSCRNRLDAAYLQRKLPHSSSPLAKRVASMQQVHGNQVASYFLSVFVSPQNGQPQFQVQNLDAWRGLVEGILERFQLVAAVSKGRRVAADQSFDQLRLKAERLVGEKSQAYDALHRDYQGLADSIRLAADGHTQGFEKAQQAREEDFAKLKVEHERAMDGLRKTFREELALRAPAAYWSDKHKGHKRWSVVTGALSFAGIGAAVCGLGFQIHDLLKGTPNGNLPETWRVAVLALIGVFSVWALRLVVRMFLSHLHLLADASERVVMVQTYLALLEGDHLSSKEDRQLILQALFRPATDGIVKDEGIPFSLAEVLTRTGKP